MSTITITEEYLEQLITAAKIKERNHISSQLRMFVNAFPVKGDYTEGIIRAAMLIEEVK
jgi:hypothetical protein